MHRSHKIQVVHARRHHLPARVPLRRHRPGKINKLHQPPAKQVANRIRIRRKNRITALRLRLPYRPHCIQIRHIYQCNRPRGAALANCLTPAKDSCMDKIAALTAILAQNPADAFARYGLAIELANSGQTDRALDEFSTLTTQSPDYVPGHQMFAQTLIKLGRTHAAAEQLHQGIAAAVRTNNAHARSEMQAMLDEIGDNPDALPVL